MSSTGQATSSLSTFQLIINAALADYAKQTGIDLTKTPFAEKIELSNSPEAILELLQEREKAFKEYREGDQTLIRCLSPAVKVLHAFSGILGEAVTLVSITYYPANCLTGFVRSPSHQQKLCLRALMFCSPYVPLTRYPTDFPVTQDFARLAVGLPRVTTLFLSFLNVWGISSSVLRYI